MLSPGREKYFWHWQEDDLRYGHKKVYQDQRTTSSSVDKSKGKFEGNIEN